MAHTTKLGSFSAPIGKYDSGKKYAADHQDPKKRGQSILNYSRVSAGNLFRTDHSDGSSRYWISMDADKLSPTLAMLAMKAGAIAADGRIIFDVYAPKPEAGNSADEQPSEPPADLMPF